MSGSDKLQPGLTPSLRVFNEGWGKNLPKEKSNLIQRITKNESICLLNLKQREHLKKGFQQFYTSKSVYNFTTPYVKTRAGKSWKLRGYKASSTRTLDISELLRGLELNLLPTHTKISHPTSCIVGIKGSRFLSVKKNGMHWKQRHCLILCFNSFLTQLHRLNSMQGE